MKKQIPTPGSVPLLILFFASCISAVFFEIFWPLVVLSVFLCLAIIAEAWNAYNLTNELDRKRWGKISELKERQEQLKKDRKGH